MMGVQGSAHHLDDHDCDIVVFGFVLRRTRETASINASTISARWSLQVLADDFLARLLPKYSPAAKQSPPHHR